jgi:hypothetical protein
MFELTTIIRSIFVCFMTAAMAGAGCSKLTPASPSQPSSGDSTTRLAFSSEPTGMARTYTLQNATFRAVSLQSGGAVDLAIRPNDPNDKSGPWTLMIGSPAGRGLSPGTYTTTPFDTDAGYGFMLLGNDNAFCDGRAGSVTIQEIDITPAALKSLRASFSIQCMRGGTVRGEVVAMAEPWR